jgi:hypothetical protein
VEKGQASRQGPVDYGGRQAMLLLLLLLLLLMMMMTMV